MFVERNNKTEQFSVGDDIRNIRKNNSVKAFELCKALNLNNTELSLIEHNKRKPSNKFIDAFSDYFNIDKKLRCSLKIASNIELLSSIFEIEKEELLKKLLLFIEKEGDKNE